MTWPSVTIVIATHDGREHLGRCLTALAGLDYPADRVLVTVVDNASSDGTAALIAERFPTVQLIRSKQNLGFAGGSNLGFRNASTDFVATLNNDVTVSPGWLKRLIRPALDDPTIAICTGKLIFARDRLRVRLHSSTDDQVIRRGPARAWLDDSPSAVEWVGSPSTPSPFPHLGGKGAQNSLSPRERVRVRASSQPNIASMELTRGPLDLGIWTEPGAQPAALRLKLDLPAGTRIDLTIGGIASPIATLDADQTLEVPIPPSATTRPVLQNTGTIVFRDGRGRDRGAVLDAGLHYYVDDLGQYDRAEEVFAGCGAGLLLRVAALADIGGFDERFFAYYEDVDLSWRARSRGWRVVYAPEAVARHVHRATTSRWSGRFVYYTERNRLMMLFKLAPLDRALGQLGRAMGAAARAGLATPYRWARRADPRGAWAIPRAAALASLAHCLPELLAERNQIQGRRRVAHAEIERWLLECS